MPTILVEDRSYKLFLQSDRNGLRNKLEKWEFNAVALVQDGKSVGYIWQDLEDLVERNRRGTRIEALIGTWRIRMVPQETTNWKMVANDLLIIKQAMEEMMDLTKLSGY